MAIETCRPTSFTITTGPGTALTNGPGVYDADLNTSATLTIGLVTSTYTATSSSFANKTQTWTSANLVIKWSMAPNTVDWDSSARIEYSLDGGTNWISTGLTIPSPYGTTAGYSIGGDGNTMGPYTDTIAISPSLSMASVKVRMSVTGHATTGVIPNKLFGAGATADIFEAYVEGTYTSGVVTSITQDQAQPPVAVAYGTNVGVTVVFSGGTCTVTPGSWGTWVSGTKQQYGPTFVDTDFTATVTPDSKTASVHIATPTIAAVTFSKNPCTVGDLVTCYAAVSNATGTYIYPSWQVLSGATYSGWYPIGGANPPNQLIPTAAGTITVRGSAQGPAGSTVYSDGVLTIYAAATGSIAASTTNAPWNATNVTVTPTFTGGTAVVGTTQGGSDISASATSGVAIGVQTGGFTQTKTYWLRVTNPAGDFVDSSVTINGYPVITSFVASKYTVLVNESFNLTAVFSNDADGSAPLGQTQGGDEYTPGAGLVSNTPQAIIPGAAGLLDFWIRCQNGAGTFIDSHIQVNVVTSYASSGKKSATASSC